MQLEAKVSPNPAKKSIKNISWTDLQQLPKTQFKSGEKASKVSSLLNISELHSN